MFGDDDLAAEIAAEETARVWAAGPLQAELVSPTPAEMAEMAELYVKHGWSLRAIAAVAGRSHTWVHKQLLTQGVAMRGVGRQGEPRPMTLDEYEREAAVTMTNWRLDNFRPSDPRMGHFLNAITGLAGEAGEVNDAAKKDIFHLGLGTNQLDRDMYAKELGDLLWYIAYAARQLDLPLEDIARRNITKLRARHNGGGFSPSYHGR